MSSNDPSKVTRREFKNAKDDIKRFFENLTKVASTEKRSKSGDSIKKRGPANIPFQLLMGNFRRKKIIDTLRDKSITYKDKTEILQPYEEYIERVLDNLDEVDKSQYGGLANKRVIEEDSEFGTESQASLKTSKMARTNKYSIKDPDGIKYSKIDIEELKKRIMDRNFSHVLKKAHREISDKGSLVNFGPNLMA